MTQYRIKCKVHGESEVIVKVGIGDKQFSVQEIWDWINSRSHSFYTEVVDSKRADVKNGVSSTARKYITTHPDGVTENNLDEIPDC